ncbi:mediator complex subunit MED14-domain-containing protein [Cantharellus anzutake]|uniref:mediator complex subunit MED14-domain-containing protein n=1 Tax=Cantharellus anzutake TaxID=1750568 RepID=UPI0019089EB2|nr:mediator complex subunit MED14-domain-containing protein [Cantharellus anzutake]KAF8343097.1 mediator complex subunit MED14-domain-containing protein [Cantharellus anzutake]
MNFAKHASSNGHSAATAAAISNNTNISSKNLRSASTAAMTAMTPGTGGASGHVASAGPQGGGHHHTHQPQQQKSVKLVIRPKAPGTTVKASTGGAGGPSSAQPVGTPLEVLEQELPPRAFADQIPLGSIIDRLVQDAYARLIELSDTLPGTPPQNRAREVDHYAVETRKQFMKAYVLSQWAKVADDVETAMAITAYIMAHNHQLDTVVQALVDTRKSLSQARLRNPDISTALTVLTLPPDQQKSLLPTIIKDTFTVEKPLTVTQVRSALLDMNHALRERLRMWEIIPLEWSNYRIDNGRVYFVAENLFTASFGLTGSEAVDTWFIIDMKFLIGAGNALTEKIASTFPQEPPPHLWAQILPGINAQLMLNAQPPSAPGAVPSESESVAAKEEESRPAAVTATEKPPNERSRGSEEVVVDAPLVRAFNLLQMLSLTYELEILLHQAEQLRNLGWRDYLNIDLSQDRRKFVLRYWLRTTPFPQYRHPKAPPQQQQQTPPSSPPMYGGVVTISISNTPSSSIPNTLLQYSNPHVLELARTLEERCMLEALRSSSSSSTWLGGSSGTTASDHGTKAFIPSDRVERVALTVRWESAIGALAIRIPPFFLESESEHITVDATNLDCESIIKSAARKHARAILRFFQFQIQNGPWRRFVIDREEAVLVDDDETPTLKLTLFKGRVLHISIDLRTGRFVFRDSGDLAAWERGYKFGQFAEVVNANPSAMLEVITRLRFNAITETIEQQVKYLGLQSSRQPGFARNEMLKLSSGAAFHVFIKLTNFPSHYIVIVVSEEGCKYALIDTRLEIVENRERLVIADLGWLDPEKLGLGPVPNDFTVRADVLQELYAFGCARVSHTRIEQQLKSRGIPYMPIFPKILPPDPESMEVHRHRAVPVIRVTARDMWPTPGSRGPEVSMANIKISVMNWWTSNKAKVITEVKLRSPPPLAFNTSRHRPSTVSGPGLSPGSLVSYDPRSSVLSFVSGEADNAIDEFLSEWDRVEKTLAIARHVAEMSRQKEYEDVQLLSFNLLAIEFTYHSDYVGLIEYNPPSLLPEPGAAPCTFKVSFSRLSPLPSRSHGSRGDAVRLAPTDNPHQQLEPYLAPRIIEGDQELTRSAVQEFVILLRSTLPLLLELESIKDECNVSRLAHPSSPLVTVVLKGAAWFRIMYNMIHALDIRMLAGGHVALLDASFSFYSPTAYNADLSSKSSSALRPIPKLGRLVDDVISTLSKDYATRMRLSNNGTDRLPVIFNVGSGLRCGNALARIALHHLHSTILEALHEGSS